MDDQEILEWFYTHDAEWQNDLISDSDSAPGTASFFEYIREYYNP